MFCNGCRNHEVDSVFVKGTNKIKLDAVKQHESSKPRQYYQSRYISNPTEPTTVQCLLKLKQNDFDNLSVRFRNVHFVAKFHKSFKDYKLLCQLDKAKGLNIGNVYDNDKTKTAAVLVKSIANKSSNFISFSCDGCTDFSGDDMESIFIRI